MIRSPTARLRAPTILAALLALVTSGCASSAVTEPGTADGAVAILGTEPPDEAEADAAVGAPPDTAARGEEATPAIDLDSLIAAIRSEAAEPRPRPILPFGVRWTPALPVEGSAIAIRLVQPLGGLEPQAVSGRLGGRAVRFGRLGDAWLGMAAVPIDTRGRQELELELRFGDGSTRTQSVPLEIAGREWEETALSVAPRYSSPPPEVTERIARERRQIRAVLDASSPEWLLDGPFDAPRPFDVTAEFGQKRVFNGELQSRHTGLDLRGQTGAPVRAAGRGRVVLAGDFYYSGNGIFVDHGLGVYTGYFHLSEILVEEGEIVERGELIGRSGATGRVTGPHLHWSLWVDGTGQDAGSLLDMEIPGS